MSEHLLDCPEIPRRLQHVRGERMPEHVRVHVLGKSPLHRPFREAALNGARRDARAAAAEKERLGVALRKRLACGKPGADRVARRGADGHDALFRALAPHAYLAMVEVDAIEIESRQLGEPQPGRIGELEQRAIAQRKHVGPLDRHQAHRFIRRQHGGQPARRAGRLETGARVVLDSRIAVLEEAEERAPRGEHPRKAPAREPAPVQRRQESPHVARRQLGEREIARRDGEQRCIADIGRSRVQRSSHQRSRERLQQLAVGLADGAGKRGGRRLGHRAREPDLRLAEGNARWRRLRAPPVA